MGKQSDKEYIACIRQRCSEGLGVWVFSGGGGHL